MKTSSLWLGLVLATSQLSLAQGTFQNLDFEEANPALGNSAATLMPGWQVFIGNSSTSTIGYDAQALSVAAVSIWDDKTGYMPIQGNFTAFLQSATLFTGGTSVSLSQTGT